MTGVWTVLIANSAAMTQALNRVAADKSQVLALIVVLFIVPSIPVFIVPLVTGRLWALKLARFETAADLSMPLA
jgi:hypothetical protein